MTRFARKALCAFLLTALGGYSGAQVDPHYRVRRSSVSAEPIFSDSGLLLRDAELLRSGKRGLSQLIHEARSKDVQRSQAARLTLLGAGDPALIPILLERIASPKDLESAVAFKTVQLYPKESWPVLVTMASKGNRGAMLAISLYEELGQPELLSLSRSSNAVARAEALSYLDDVPRFLEALGDPAKPVRQQAAKRLASIPDVDRSTLLEDSREEVRALMAEFSQRWTRQGQAQWVRLAKDPSPRVRKWAMLHLSSLGLDWGNGPWTSDGIAAVARGIKEGPEEVREMAVLAARGWILDWPKTKSLWTPAQVAEAQAVFRLPAFREAVYRQAQTERRWEGAIDVLDIQLPPAHQALALSGDPRAVPLFRRRISKEPFRYVEWIKSLAYLPGRPTADLLFDLIDHAARRPAPSDNSSSDFEFDQVVGWSIGSLREIGVRDFRRAFVHLDSKRIDARLRLSLARMLAPTGDGYVVTALAGFATDLSQPEWLRLEGAYGLANCPNPVAKLALERLSKGGTDTNVRDAATTALRQWGERFSQNSSPRP